MQIVEQRLNARLRIVSDIIFIDGFEFVVCREPALLRPWAARPGDEAE